MGWKTFHLLQRAVLFKMRSCLFTTTSCCFLRDERLRLVHRKPWIWASVFRLQGHQYKTVFCCVQCCSPAILARQSLKQKDLMACLDCTIKNETKTVYAMRLARKAEPGCLGTLVRQLGSVSTWPFRSCLHTAYIRYYLCRKKEQQGLEETKVGPVTLPHSSSSLGLTFIKSIASFASLSKKSRGKSRSGGLDCPYPRGSQATTVKHFLFRLWSCGAKSVLPLPKNSQGVTFWMSSV